MGRTQVIEENLSLCPNNYHPDYKFKIIPPEDGLPVALIVSNGDCTLEEKAAAAVRMIEPTGIVQYLIVKDHSRRLKGLDGIEEAETDDGMSDFDGDDGNDQSLESTGRWAWKDQFAQRLDPQEMDDESYTSQPDFTRRLLLIDDQPHVAILHVTSTVGKILTDMVLSESQRVKKLGGTKIFLNGDGPNAAKMILTWVLAVLFMCACGCCCMLMAVQREWEDEQPPAPTQPVRRRLTLQQVRAKFPAFHFNPDDHHHPQSNETSQYCQLLDECTICLDAFHAGVRCWQLPCQHVFHSTCIARWLIERSAVCPLCKLDLYEEEEDDNNEEEERSSNEPIETERFLSRQWWMNLATTTRQPASTTDASENVQPPQIPQSANPNHLESSQPNETRTWGPFSMETTLNAEDHDHVDARPTSLSRWSWNLFGRRRRLRPQVALLSNDAAVTELTEPLLSDGHPDTNLPLQTQNSLEEATYSTSGLVTDVSGSGAAATASGANQPATATTTVAL